ncbi:MAG: hypothetical protein R3322_00740 [Kiloniellales bacterium]|nr:hypothetical protein [Kiloniellales bacterium]
MEDQTHHARVVALSMAHGAALAKLLRAHGKHDHADNIDAALKEFADIVSSQVGTRALEQALCWAARQALEEGGLEPRAEPA